MPYEYRQFYIDGRWVDPIKPAPKFQVINPATEEMAGVISMASAADVDRPLRAARRRILEFLAHDGRRSGVRSLRKILAGYKSRYDEFANRHQR